VITVPVDGEAARVRPGYPPDERDAELRLLKTRKAAPPMDSRARQNQVVA
jgi:hypothetical protein